MYNSVGERGEQVPRKRSFRDRRFMIPAMAALAIATASIVTPLILRRPAESESERQLAAYERFNQAFRGHGRRLLSNDNGCNAALSFDKPAGICDGDLASLKELALLDFTLEWLDLRGTDVTGAGMIHLAALPTIKHLYLDGLPIDDEGMAHLKALTELERLALGYSLVTDAGIRHLVGLRSLQGLGLSHTNVGDESLALLKQLPRLTSLGLNGTRVTDAGLIHVAEMKQLRELYLQETAVTDAGLVHFRSLQNLRELSLGNTKCTPDAAAELEKALPYCSIGYRLSFAKKKSSEGGRKGVKTIYD